MDDDREYAAWPVVYTIRITALSDMPEYGLRRGGTAEMDLSGEYFLRCCQDMASGRIRAVKVGEYDPLSLRDR